MPDGTKQLLPKDDGQGVMISSFVARELGYRFQPSQLELEEINKKRKCRKYSDEEAAIEKNGTSLKSDLKESPFVRELDYGINYDGYWTYGSMVLQLED